MYVIDTSSIIAVIDDVPRNRRPALFRALSELVQQDQLLFPREVFKELDRATNKRKPDEAFIWAHSNKASAVRIAPSQDNLREVLSHPQAKLVLDPDKTGVEEADPYVLALAMDLRDSGHIAQDVVVVTQETRDRPSKLSMATACGLLRLYRIPLLGLVAELNLSP